MVIQCPGYFIYATGTIQELGQLVIVIGVIGRVISRFKIILRARLPPNCTTSPISNCVNNKMRETLELKV